MAGRLIQGQIGLRDILSNEKSERDQIREDEKREGERKQAVRLTFVVDPPVTRPVIVSSRKQLKQYIGADLQNKRAGTGNVPEILFPLQPSSRSQDTFPNPSR